MQRLTISLDDRLAAELDELMRLRGYSSRSEAFRDMLRRELGQQAATADPQAPFIAVLSYVYDHHERQLATRLTELQHDHHELTVSTMHAHLSHDECVETAILRGPPGVLNDFAQSVIAQTGVRHGSINLIPLDAPATRNAAMIPADAVTTADHPHASGHDQDKDHRPPHKHV